MIRLKEEEILKLSELTGVAQSDIEKLYAMNLLNDSAVFDYLIKTDFSRLNKVDKYQPNQIISAICDKYDVNRVKVRNAIYAKKSRFYYCELCNKRITKSEYTRNNKICDKCMIKSIKV